MNSKFLTLSSLFLIAFTSCSDSTSDEFDDANPEGVARYIETIAVVSAQDSQENTTVTVNYDANDRVSSITDGTESSIFVYNNGGLSNVSGQGDNLNIEELYESPYDAFEAGVVTQYDSNGNPKMITFYETEYDYMTNTETDVEYTAEVTYDANPNPYFYTLKAAGVIAVMDNVDLHLTMNSTSSEIVQARALFPLNNIISIKYRDNNGDLVYNLSADYVYNSVNYPVSGTLTAVSYERYDGQVDTYTDIYSANYTYRD